MNLEGVCKDNEFYRKYEDQFLFFLFPKFNFKAKKIGLPPANFDQTIDNLYKVTFADPTK